MAFLAVIIAFIGFAAFTAQKVAILCNAGVAHLVAFPASFPVLVLGVFAVLFYDS